MESRLSSKVVHTACAATILSFLSGGAGAQAPLFWSLAGNAGTNPATSFLGTTDGKPLVIQPGSGNVGIGTTNPAVKLDVAQNSAIRVGNAYVSSGEDPQYAYAMFASNAWYNGKGGVVSGIPDSTRKSGLLEFANDELNIYQTQTAGKTDWGRRFTIASGGNVNIGPVVDPAIPYPKFTVTGANATPNVETAEVMRLMRHGVPGIKNQNSAGFFVGSFEQGILGRSQLDIRVAGLPDNSNTFGSVPDVTSMSLLGNGNINIGPLVDPAIPYARLTVTGANTTPNVETAEVMRLMRHGVPGIKNQNSAGFFVGSFEQGILGRSQLDIRVAGVPGNWNTFGSVPDITVMSLLANGNVGIGTSTPQTQLHVNGTATVGVLQITGGSDLAEPFAMDREAVIQPGMVVAIDPTHPGRLRLADRAYDRTVAGIVSGANGIKPGLTMTSDTAAHHSRPVALTGRVYVFADASHDPIQPGDLLTTADIPGHAMKVTDYARAQGAIVGKAMSALPGGTGLVLVLVSLQ